MPVERLTEDEVQVWFRRINMSKKWKEPYEKVWDRIIDYFKGKYYEDLSDEDRVCINMVHPHIRTVIPAVYARNPDVLVIPRRKDEYEDELIRKRAEVMQNLLRYYMKELDLKTEMKLSLLDAIISFHGWMKTGYDAEFEEEGETLTEEPETIISKFLKTMGLKEQDEEEKEEFNYNVKITNESPWALRTSIYDMFLPALTRRAEEAFWIAERFIEPIEITLANPDFDTEGLKPSANANDLLAGLRGSKYQPIPDGEDLKYIIRYEIWDNQTKMVHNVAEGNKKPLSTKDSEYTFLDSKNHPYVHLRLGEVTDEFYPVSELQAAEPQLLELNEIRTQLRTHVKRYNRKYLSRPGALDAPNRENLKKSEDGITIEVTDTHDDKLLADIISPLADASLPPEIYAVEGRVKDDIRNILGTTDYTSESTGGAPTATEASIVASQGRVRVEERIDLVSEFAGRIVRNIAQIVQRFMDEEQVGAVVGQDAIYWVQMFSRREIQGEFSYNVAYGSTAPINRETDRNQFMQFVMIAKDDPYYNQPKLRLHIVRKFDLENPESWLNPRIAQMIEFQRLQAAKRGDLLQLPQNALGSLGEPGRVPSQGGGGKLPTGQPRGLPGSRGQAPRIPGGKGGTQIRDSGY